MRVERCRRFKPMSAIRVIFLDIDGVLRTTDSDPCTLNPKLMHNFTVSIGPLPDVQIVISSTWRQALSLRDIKSHLCPSISSKVIGATPTLEAATQRQDEIDEYRKNHGIGPDEWIAVDDAVEEFSNDAHLVVTQPDVGFDSECVIRLWELAGLL